jgi:transposase
MEDDNDNEATYTTRRSMTMLHKQGLPFKRRSHDVGLNYLMPNKKDKRRSSNAEKHKNRNYYYNIYILLSV